MFHPCLEYFVFFLSISKLISVYASLSEVVHDITYLRLTIQMFFFFQSSEVVCERFGCWSISTNRRGGLLISTATLRVQARGVVCELI